MLNANIYMGNVLSSLENAPNERDAIRMAVNLMLAVQEFRRDYTGSKNFTAGGKIVFDNLLAPANGKPTSRHSSITVQYFKSANNIGEDPVFFADSDNSLEEDYTNDQATELESMTSLAVRSYVSKKAARSRRIIGIAGTLESNFDLASGFMLLAIVSMAVIQMSLALALASGKLAMTPAIAMLQTILEGLDILFALTFLSMALIMLVAFSLKYYHKKRLAHLESLEQALAAGRIKDYDMHNNKVLRQINIDYIGKLTKHSIDIISSVAFACAQIGEFILLFKDGSVPAIAGVGIFTILSMVGLTGMVIQKAIGNFLGANAAAYERSLSKRTKALLILLVFVTVIAACLSATKTVLSLMAAFGAISVDPNAMLGFKIAVLAFTAAIAVVLIIVTLSFNKVQRRGRISNMMLESGELPPTDAAVDNQDLGTYLDAKADSFNLHDNVNTPKARANIPYAALNNFKCLYETVKASSKDSTSKDFFQAAQTMESFDCLQKFVFGGTGVSINQDNIDAATNELMSRMFANALSAKISENADNKIEKISFSLNKASQKQGSANELKGSELVVLNAVVLRMVVLHQYEMSRFSQSLLLADDARLTPQEWNKIMLSAAKEYKFMHAAALKMLPVLNNVKSSAIDAYITACMTIIPNLVTTALFGANDHNAFASRMGKLSTQLMNSPSMSKLTTGSNPLDMINECLASSQNIVRLVYENSAVGTQEVSLLKTKANYPVVSLVDSSNGKAVETSKVKMGTDQNSIEQEIFAYPLLYYSSAPQQDVQQGKGTSTPATENITLVMPAVSSSATECAIAVTSQAAPIIPTDLEAQSKSKGLVTKATLIEKQDSVSEVSILA